MTIVTNPVGVACQLQLRLLLEEVGCEILQIRRNRFQLNVRQKEGLWDIVSVADHVVEDKIANFLRQHFPDHGIDSEEGCCVDSNSGFTWVVDPVDGTANFVSGMDLFGISLGLTYDNFPIFGIIHYPALGKMLWAVEGGGAFLNGVRLNTGPFQGELSEALINGDILREDINCYASILRCCRNVLVSGSHTGAALYLVEERIASIFHSGATKFDIVAAAVIAWEVGCVVSGIWDDGINFTKKRVPILMSRGKHIHDELRVVLCEKIMAHRHDFLWKRQS